MSKVQLIALKSAFEARAIACANFANRPGTWEKDALLYRGQSQAYKEAAELIDLVIKETKK